MDQVAANQMGENLHFDPTIWRSGKQELIPKNASQRSITPLEVLNASTFSAIPHGSNERLLRREAVTHDLMYKALADVADRLLDLCALTSMEEQV